ncbi:unnamed protein product [Durusdinium trenchii]|uniref:Uncharacterized protein n=1 Tax=Durusdinium trenchii TaxID=1381693 RepID=A0ABP0PUL4_9DINO
MLLFWTALDSTCNAQLPVGPNWPFEAPSGGCIAKANLEWVLTPGIVEETSKFIVLTRLVTSLEEAMNSRALTRWPRSSTTSCMPCCGWFLKMASSPAVVVLCGMAVGGGFGSLENVQYIAKISGLVKQLHNILPATVRIYTAILHVAMTGTCAFFLSISMFSERKRPFVKFIGWILMVICHGTYDAFCTFQSELDIKDCFTRASCTYDYDKGEEECVFSESGTLAHCSCISSVNESTHKCTPTPDAASMKRDQISNSILLILKDSGFALVRQKESKEQAEADSLHNFWQFNTAPKVRQQILAAIPQKAEYVCPKNPEHYVCGPKLVEWWPGAWTSWLLGTVMILFFAILACCGLPQVQRSFYARQEVAQTAVNPAPGSQVQLA